MAIAGWCGRSFGWIAATLLFVGCAQPGYDIRVALDPEFRRSLGDERVFVHLVPADEHARWEVESMSVDGYWQYGSARGGTQSPRDRGTVMFELSAANPSALLKGDD